MACALLLLPTAGAMADGADVLVVPSSSRPLRIAIDLASGAPDEADGVQLVETGEAGSVVPAQLVPRLSADGTVGQPRGRLVAVVPPKAAAEGQRRFRLQRTPGPGPSAKSAFALTPVDDRSLKITEAGKPVLVYNYGTIVGQNVPVTDHRRERACYIHPVWGLDGEILTDDFPRDHFHHHGIFWAWPHVRVGGDQYDLWTYGKIQQRFVRWLDRQVGPVTAVLGVENGWFVGQRQVMTERVWVCVYRAGDRDRAIDLDLFFVPHEEISLQGAGGKSYGGLTMRFAVRQQAEVTITVPEGRTTEDLKETPLAWADLTARFEGASERSGGAVFVHPDHPDFPPTWLTRHYGPQCVGWPGVQARAFPAGKPFRLPYRVWLHRGVVEHQTLQAAYAAYTASTKVAWTGRRSCTSGKRTEIAYQRSGTVPIFAEALRSENGTVPFTPASGVPPNWVYYFRPLASVPATGRSAGPTDGPTRNEVPGS